MAQHLVQSIEQLREMVKELCNHDRLAHDTETYGPSEIGGLYPFHGARAFSHVFATKDDEYYVDFNNKINWKYKKELQPIFDDPNRIIFYINAIFDGSISHFDGIKFNQRIVDGQDIARVEYNLHKDKGNYEESLLSMNYLADYYQVQRKSDKVWEHIREHDLYQKDDDGNYIVCKFKGKKIPEFQKVPIEIMFLYGCGDVRTTFDVCTKVLQCINYKDTKYINERPDGTPKLIEVAKREIAVTSVVLDAHIKGFKHWDYYTTKAIKRENTIYEKHATEVRKQAPNLNFNSGAQVGTYLVEQGVEVPRNEPTAIMLERSKTWYEKAQNFKAQNKDKKYHEAMAKSVKNTLGNYKTDKVTLEKLIEQYTHLDGINHISKAKKAQKKISTYYSNFKTLQDIDNIIHASLNQSATITGRFSCSQPNLQNLHKEQWKEFDDQGKLIITHEWLIRKSFIADKHFRLFFADYSQQEMIVMLDQAGEHSVIDKLKSGEYKDFYLAVKAILKELLDIDMSRSDIKEICLALAYGLGDNALGVKLGFIKPNDSEDDIEEGITKVKEFKDNFFKALPKLKKFEKKLQRDIRQHGKIINAFGRVIYIDKQFAYKALNAYVQSSSADITKASMIAVHKGLKEAGLESRFTLSVHDENVFNIKLGEEDKALPIIEKCMIEAYPFKHIALKIDFEYSEINEMDVSAWGEKQHYEYAFIA